MFFTDNFLRIGDSMEISLKYVESIQFSRGEDLTADALKGDRTFRVRMISGIEHEISIQRQMTQWQLDYLKRISGNQAKDELKEYESGILSNWKFNVTGVKE